MSQRDQHSAIWGPLQDAETRAHRAPPLQLSARNPLWDDPIADVMMQRWVQMMWEGSPLPRGAHPLCSVSMRGISLTACIRKMGPHLSVGPQAQCGVRGAEAGFSRGSGVGLWLCVSVCADRGPHVAPHVLTPPPVRAVGLRGQLLGSSPSLAWAQSCFPGHRHQTGPPGYS